jgi:4-hydroxybenzoate polyprenyltransferase
MYSVRVFFIPYFIHQTCGTYTPLDGEAINFFLLVFSTVLIAAGGNIINDYFDVKADRINKPEKLIIGKYIKPRWAIVVHWLFNFVAFAIACGLSWRYETFWYVFIHLFSINALWFYSMYFKRKFFIGNFLIAALTGLVPILSGIFFLDITTPFNNSYLPTSWSTPNASWISGLNLKIFFVLAFAFFAMALNLVREIVKDMEDIEGDKILRAKTLPIVLGHTKTKWIAIALLTAYLIIPIPFIIEAYTVYGDHFIKAMAPAGLIVFGILLAVVSLMRTIDKRQLKRVDLMIKLMMVIGCCLPFYWYFLS